jgi:D-alanyl-lipoteichoic acid acyltransferase DltB (MBOAT superfamily)
MLFNSWFFVAVFLPVCIFVYPLLYNRKREAGLVFLLVSSLLFYGWAGLGSLALVLVCAAVSLLVTLLMRKADPGSRQRKLFLAGGIVLNVAVLAYCKYSGFIADTLGAALGSDMTFKSLILPVGLSFYTFTQISYLVDAYRGEADDDTVLEYFTYIFYFPKILSGPIAFRNFFMPEIRKKRAGVSPEVFSQSLMRFVYGLSKKLLLADQLARAADWGFANIDFVTSGDVWLVMAAYTFQIYFDFSGYTDMAIAVSDMLGISLPRNFDSPYQSLSINDFWKRWHMTLTDFLRRYIYFPLGGSRKGTACTVINIMAIYLISGIWHGAAWTFILWGALNGILCVIHRLAGHRFDSCHIVFRWAVNMVVLMFLWLLFRSESLSEWITLVLRAVRFESLDLSQGLIDSFQPAEGPVLYMIPVLGTVLAKIRIWAPLTMLFICLYVILNCENTDRRKYTRSFQTAIGTALLLIWCLMSFGMVSTYAYFGF